MSNKNIVVTGASSGIGKSILEELLAQNPDCRILAACRRAEMIADLRARLGFDVVRVEVGEIDFLHDIAVVTVFYRPRNSAKGSGK